VSVTYKQLPNAAHALTFEKGHDRLDSIVADFLRAHGL